jgi:hypothetical protein
MACVYRARLEGVAGISKEVALKLVHSHLSEDQDFVAMFLDEMRVAMAMSHRNIVQTFDAGKHDDQYFLVMELVDGCSLRALIDLLDEDGEQLPIDVALFVGMEVSAALDYAHGLAPEGVIHRDVSPSNILLTAQGDVKLADFGVAKAAGRLFVTTPNLVKGKQRYMAPEQARGQPSRASDLFALGAVLYEALCGEGVRKGPGLELGVGGRLAALEELRPAIPAETAALVLRCLEEDAARRPASAQELRRSLAREAFRLKALDSISIDPHARLSAFLAVRLPRLARVEEDGGAAPVQAAPAAAALAEAVLKGALAVPTDPALRQAPLRETASQETTEPSASEPRAQPAIASSPTREARREAPTAAERPSASRRDIRRLPRAMMIASGALLIAAGAIIGALYLGRDAPSRASRASPSRANSSPRVEDAAAGRPNSRARADAARREDRGRKLGAEDHAAAPPPDAGSGRVILKRPPARRAPGYLDLNAVPWAAVWIDGRHVGETPLQGLALAPGTHRIRLENPRRRLSKTIVVVIRSGQTLRQIVTLQ